MQNVNELINFILTSLEEKLGTSGDSLFVVGNLLIVCVVASTPYHMHRIDLSETTETLFLTMNCDV